MSNELNKIAGAGLGTLMIVMGIHIGAGIIFTPKKPVIAGYELPGGEVAAAAGPAAAADEPLTVRLAKAEVARGEKAVGACKACHAFEKGGANKIGPALWGIYEKAKAATAGFGYSAASKAKASETWTAENLDAFLKNPKAYLPGTSMAFAGVGNAASRADIVAYLNSLADAPKPLPK
jgi:cytochrome c